MVALLGLELKGDGKMGGYLAAMLQKGQRAEVMVRRCSITLDIYTKIACD